MWKLAVSGWLLAVGIAMATDAWAEESAGTVWYYDYKDRQLHSSPKACRELDSAVYKLEDGGWYVVSETRTIDHTIEVEMEDQVAHIILCDGVTLTVNGTSGRPGIDVMHNGSLHIYGQHPRPIGTLIAKGGVNGAGIGCKTNSPEKIDHEYTGRLEFHSGRIVAIGGDYGAGIGGSRDSFGNSLIIYGGEVSATGGCWAAGIGAGAYAGHGYFFPDPGPKPDPPRPWPLFPRPGEGGAGVWTDDLQHNCARMTVWPGAKVQAKGGRYGAGIGGSYRGGDGCGGFQCRSGESFLKLHGCTVWAEGGEGAAGIGGGKGGSDGGCEIYGGNANISAFGGAGTFGIGAGAGWDGPDPIEYKVFAVGCDVKEGSQPPGATTYIQKSKNYYHGLSHARFTNIQTSNQVPPEPSSVTYWDGEYNKEYVRKGTEYSLIGGGTQTLTSYGWYVVRGNVKMTDHGLWCSGPDVHIILTDGCLFEIEAPDDSPGIELDERVSLHIHPEHKDGTGTMIVSGGLNGAGIGGGVNTNDMYLSSGKLTIHGGRITCMGGAYAAGIGGSSNKGGMGGGLGSDLTIYGGEVTAFGGWASAGIGGAAFGSCGGAIFIDGGSIRAFGGLSRSGWLPGIGCGAGEKSERKDINTSALSRKRDFVVREGDDESVSCRIVKNDTYFSVGTNSYVGILVGRTERVAYRDGRGDMREVQAEMLIPGESPVFPSDTTLERWFIAEDGISFTQTLTLPGKTANLILSDDSSLSFATGSSSSPALKAKALNIFGQELGTGMMKVQGGSSASGISTDEDFVLHSCLVDVTGARDGVSGGSLTISNGYLRVACQQAALTANGAVTMNGGTLIVTNGVTHAQASSLTVSGGNLFVERNKLAGGAAQPKNTEGATLYRLMVVLPDWFGKIDDETIVRIKDWNGPASYGLDGLYPLDGRIYLWLPDGKYKFNVDCFGLKIPYEALISGNNTMVNPCEEIIDLKVNGVPIMDGQGDGWTYERGDGVLRLGERSGPFVISGSSTKGEVQIFAGSNADIVLSNARVYTSGRSAMMLAPNVSVNLRMQDGESFLSASGKWIRRRGDVTGAGIEVCPTASLTITGSDSSILWVNGGYGSAGIGGSSRVGLGCPHSGYIHILSGTVIAMGGDRGAGIGGGQRGLPYPYSGDAILLGRDANVTATGGWGAAGIGGGWGGLRNVGGLTAQGKVRLNGAIVSATGGKGAAGIGGGRYYARKRRRQRWLKQAAQYPAVEICGGTVYAMGGGNDEIPWRTPCSDIGQGEGSDETDESVFVRITGGTVVAARDMIAPDPIGEYAGRRYSSPLVLRASVKDGGFPENEPVSLDTYFPYGIENIYPINGMIHLYLPDFGPDHPSWYYFNANKAGYIATMCGTNTVAQRCKEPDEWSLTVEFADHVSKDFAVSNRLGKIEGSKIDDGMVYGVKTYDRVTIDFAVDDGYVRRGGNRIVIPKVEDHVIVTQEDLAVHPYRVFDEGLNVVRSDGGQWIDLDYHNVASTRVECVAWPEISVGPGTDWSHFLSGLTTALLTLKIYEGETLVRDLVPFMSSDGSGIIGLYDTVTRKPFVNMGTGNFTLDNLGVTPYRAWNAETRQMEDRLCTNATQFVATNTTVLKSGWYEVSGNVKIGEGGIDIVGSVHLILCDGADMFLDSYGLDRPGIRVEEGASLSIYGQDKDSGKLTVRAGNDAAAIGGAFRKTCGIVDIHGGEITAVQFNRCMQGKGAAGIGGGAGNYDEKGGGGGDIRIHGGTVTVTYSQDGWASGAGIGGGSYADGGTVVIDGGTVTVQGGTFGAGIGGGRSGSGGTVTINGGTVEARGGSGINGDRGAAGIGSGGETGRNPSPPTGGVTTINGGFVKAIGSIGAFGIGAGASSHVKMTMGVITINGGTVVTTESDSKDPSIGGDTMNSRLTINGGSIKAWTVADLAKNSTPTNVYCVTVKCEGLKVEKLEVEGLGNYGTNDIYPIDGRVYLWLPNGTHNFALSDGEKTYRYYAEVKGIPITVEPLVSVGFLVNGEDIGVKLGDGWVYDGSVLSLNSAKTYILSGAATNNEVQVKVMQQGATVVLSNAVVFAEGREALDVTQSAALQMAGGASFLGTAKDFAAVKVAEDMALAVDLAPGADRQESMVGVFNSGNAKAIAGKGSVKANGGTFFVWADGQAVETPSGFTVGAGVVMKTGDKPETMRFATVCGNAPCVLAAPGVTVTVKNIPHVTGHTVSNAVEEILGADFPAGKVYRVMIGDDVFVGYTLEEGYVSKSPNPLVYLEVEGDKTVDAGSIRVLQNIPYRAWNETTRQMEDRVCTEYAVVTAETRTFEDGMWYVVTNSIKRGRIEVNGSAHLILCDGARLETKGAIGTAAIIVEGWGKSLSIYGQSEGTGELEATGGDYGAGIGGGMYRSGGTITINGGKVTATGCLGGAGIGGGDDNSGGTVTINGGVVIAEGSLCAAGIGGGDHSLLTPRTARSIVINGGTVQALGEKYGLRGSLTIDGGSVLSKKWQPNDAKNSMPTNVYCVTVKCPGLEGLVGLAGLDGYGTNDIYAVANWQGVDCVYLWLPNGTYHFTLSDGTTTYGYCAVVKGKAITVEPLGPVWFFVNGKDIGGGSTSEDGWTYLDRVLTLEGAKTYVLSGSATNNEVQVKVAQAGATVVLSNAVVFASGRTAFDVAQSTALQMAGCASFLAATNNAAAVSVGPNVSLAVALAPGANRNEAMIGVFNYGNVASIHGAGSVAMNGGTLAVWADRRASEVPLTRAADVFCMLAGNDPETAKAVDRYDGEAYVFVTAAIALVTPGTPIGPFETAVTATNAAQVAVINPRDDVAAALGTGEALETYCNMFGFAVTGGGEAWFVNAALTPEAWTNVTESAQEATRQIPLADIAAMTTEGKKDVSVTNCVPGFYYTLYGAATLPKRGGLVETALPEGTAYGPKLSGVSGEVTFPEVMKPSDAAGFFTIGVKETSNKPPVIE